MMPGMRGVASTIDGMRPLVRSETQALIALMVMVGAGVATISRELRIACSSISLHREGDVRRGEHQCLRLVVELLAQLLDERFGAAQATVQPGGTSTRLTVTVPPGSNTGSVLRLKGKGIAPPSGTPGDHYVHLDVVLPKAPDSELRAFLEEWRKTHRYDPRKG